MRCGQHGCPCTTCQDCWYDLDQCKCDLIKDSRRFIEQFERESDLVDVRWASELLKKWLGDE